MATAGCLDTVRAVEAPPARGRLPGISGGKLAAGALAFLALTVGIFWYQFHRIHAGDVAPRWDQLRWGYLALILLVLPVETVTSSLRTWLLCRILQPGVSRWTCIQAEWANVAISMLTPSQSGGGAGQIYVLWRGGVRVGTALTVALISFLGTMVGLFAMGVYSLTVSRIAATGPLFVGAIWTLTAISAALVMGAAWPGLFRVALARVSRALLRLAGRGHLLRDWWPPHDPRTGPPADRLDRLTGQVCDVVYTYRDDVRRFLRHGKATFVGVCLLSVIFLFSRALLPYLCLRFLGIGVSSLGEILQAQLALIFLIFFAPTPGGAGVAEWASLSIMAEIVPVGFAPYYNLLWRFSTAYLAALAGLLCLARGLLQDARAKIGRRS